MSELITISQSSFNGEVSNSVDARELYAGLGAKKEFSNWVKAQIERAQLIENTDYMVYAQKGVNLKGGRPTFECVFTVESAKHIAMMAGTEKGKEVRQYFIECERKLKQTSLNPTNMTRLQLLEMAMQAEQERLALEHKVEEMQPDVQALERIAKAEGSLCVTDAAKQLQIQPKKLFGFLFANEWIFKRTGTSAWAGYQDKLRQGLIEHKIEVIQRIDGTDKLVTQVRITAKGMAKLAKMLSSQSAQTISVQ